MIPIMPLPDLPTLQDLHHLDRSSPEFSDQLSDTLYGEEYQRCVSNIRDGDLLWLVDYLDKVLDDLEPSNATSRKCLRELRSICGTRGILPASYMLSSDILSISPEPFASGGYGDVYMGSLGDSSVCIKRVRAYTSDDPQRAKKLFCQEAVVWKHLTHPNVLPLLGVTVTPFQLISSWMSGGDLPCYLKENPEADRLGLLSDVARGLCHLHSCNVIHGDLKGPNVLVDHSGNALIADFGLATVAQNLDSVQSATHRGGHTPRWAAPEVLTEGTFSKEADVFSFAMVMIEVFTGAVPFSDKTPTMAILNITQGMRPPRPTHPTFTTELWTLMERCWDQNHDLRPDVSEVLTTLSGANAVGIPQSEGTSDEVAGAVIETGHDVSTPVAPTESANNNTGRPTIWDLSSVASCFNVFSFFVNIVYDTTDAHDMKNFINKPVSHPLPYELLSKNILEETPLRHDDLDTIPAVLDVIQGLGNETEPGVVSAKQKEELRRYNANLVFKVGENIDMDLLNENRLLIHTGKLLRQPDTGFKWGGWTKVFALLFDNYLVMTKPKERDGVTIYQVYRRPIPLDLLTLAAFTDPPTQRGGRILPFGGNKKDAAEGPSRNVNPPGAAASPDAVNDARAVYPCTIHHNGRLGGLYTLYTETSQERLEWKAKLEEAIGLRKVVQESNKVFKVETLSVDTFSAPTLIASAGLSWNNDGNFTGKVTCSVPFTTPDGHSHVAIGCAKGVWVGSRQESQSMRRVFHLQMVSQCAVLEDFGVFLVLADKSLFAYHIEALVPPSPGAANASQAPQKLNGNRDVQFFTVGNLGGRTLVIYMKKNDLNSVFRVLEPDIGKINERTKAQPTTGSRFGLRSQRSEWFRVYRDFFLPSDSYDLLFLTARTVILCSKGFEIMDLSDFNSVIIPQKEDPKLAKRCESCRPMGMFRSNKDEFLLCYDEFGLYVDKHGDPSRLLGTIEWEGTAERVAWHPPYILLFDSRFIEIRHVETGRLVQIISGSGMRCIWDGRGANRSQAVSEESSDDMVSHEPRVHGVMNTEVVQPGRGVTTQHVFELIPTVPLPGSSASPSRVSYFNQSNSPPS